MGFIHKVAFVPALFKNGRYGRKPCTRQISPAVYMHPIGNRLYKGDAVGIHVFLLLHQEMAVDDLRATSWLRHTGGNHRFQ